MSSFIIAVDSRATVRSALRTTIEFLRPLQARYADLESDPAAVRSALAKGAEKAQAAAAVTLERAKRNIGLLAR